MNPPRRILVADDSASTAEDLELTLKELGYEITAVAASGKDSVQKAELTTPDIALLGSVFHGEMNALQTAEYIRSHCDIPVVLLITQSDTNILEQTDSFGPCDYVTKPFSKEMLSCTIEMALYKHEMDKRLKESEERFRTLAQATFEGVAIHRKGRILDANATYAQMFGYERSEVLGMSLVDFAPPEHRTLVSESICEGFDRRFEAVALRKDGTTIPVELGTKPITYLGKRASVTAIRDITEQKTAEERLRNANEDLERRVIERTEEVLRVNQQLRQEIADREKAEAALRESEEKYRLVFSNERDAILVRDALSQECLDVNDAAERLYGYSREEFLKMKAVDLSAEPEKSKAALDSPIGPEGLFIPLRLHKKKDGTAFPAEISASAFTWKGRRVVCSIIRDISERRKAEQALRESEERFRAVFESAGEYIYIKDRSLRYTHVNPALCELVRLQESEIIGKRAEDLLERQTAEQLMELQSRALAGESLEVELSRTVGGVPMTFHDSLVPLRSADGDIIGICGISRNVTERKRLATESLVRATDYPSKAMRATMEKARIAAGTDCNVLFQGESGSGKDYLARWIHDHSRRAGGPFFSVNCAAISRELAESELFGHERGSFTGAAGSKRGLLELAEGGTILLNEIGELDLSLQAKLLTFLDTKSFVRVGGQKPVHINARLIAASHRDLSMEVAEGRFLQPLFYRLEVFPITVPPLRERIEDIPSLAEELLSQVALELQISELPVIDADHIRDLALYHWPGNIRELRNVIEQSLIVWDGGRLKLALPDLRAEVSDWSCTVDYLPGKSLATATDELARSFCIETLRRTSGNKKLTAETLGISREKLYRLMKRFGIDG